jgi:hypothetical protein
MKGGKLGGVGLLAKRQLGGRAWFGGPWAENTGIASRKRWCCSGPPVHLKRLGLARVQVEANPWAGGTGRRSSWLLLFLPATAATARVAAGMRARAGVVAVESDLG